MSLPLKYYLYSVKSLILVSPDRIHKTKQYPGLRNNIRVAYKSPIFYIYIFLYISLYTHGTLTNNIQQYVKEINTFSTITNPRSQTAINQTCGKSDHYLQWQSRKPNTLSYPLAQNGQGLMNNWLSFSHFCPCLEFRTIQKKQTIDP